MRKVYCHVDLLAARELPAMDDDGLVDPSYSIQVKDQACRLGVPFGGNGCLRCCLRFILDASSVLVHSREIPRYTKIYQDTKPTALWNSTVFRNQHSDAHRIPQILKKVAQ